jgi:hypothetical protein
MKGRKQHHVAKIVSVRVKETGRVIRMELTTDAVFVAKAFMDLPKNKRDEFRRKIEIEAMPYMSRVPDEQLAHLAAPKRTVAATPKKRTRVPGTQ